ncbi:hypothetical protein LR48_Vigan10g277100 [Vigna angularis]|uniref:Uncharacterized protein n=1 Tax=Phaseolus angularis TaxID=3914 RepID=A0A0L9VQ54_PHAAN|nr:hypothetical protein LR48_Vigan10g277100 [Vigna angularis]
MANSRRPRRRTAGASSSRSRDVRPASIEGWISDQEKHADFANFWQECRLMEVKFISSPWGPGLQSLASLPIISTTSSTETHNRQLLVGAFKKRVCIEGELTQAIQAIDTEIGETTFRQMGFVVRGRVIIHKDDDHQNDEDDDMDAHMAEPVGAATPSEAGPSTMPSSFSLSMEEYFANLSKQLEDMSLAHQACFDELIEM